VYQNLKDTTVSYKSVDIAPHREEIRKKVQTLLDSELTPHSITIQDFLISNITFDPAFQQAIEDKQTATQNALKEQETIKLFRHRHNKRLRKPKEKVKQYYRKHLSRRKQIRNSQNPLRKTSYSILLWTSLVTKLR